MSVNGFLMVGVRLNGRIFFFLGNQSICQKLKLASCEGRGTMTSTLP